MRSRSENGRRSAFTLVELMITIAIVAVLASVGMSALTRFIHRSKRSEAYAHVGGIYRHYAAYYEREWSGGSLGSSTLRHCLPTVYADHGHGYCPIQGDPNLIPTAQKRKIDCSQSEVFRDMGYSIPDPVYYSYVAGTGNTGSFCAPPAGTEFVLGAIGDLDGDGILSGHVLFAGINDNGELTRGPGFHEWMDIAVNGLPGESE